MKKLAAATSLALLAALIPATSIARTAACDTVALRNWNIRVDVRRRAYELGDKAKVELTVTRKKTDTPVAGVMAVVMIFNTEKHAVFGGGETDAAGREVLSVRLAKRRLETGPVKLFAYAHRTQLDAYCASVGEYGFRRVPGAFRIKH
jgi:hypothetical protein